MEVISLDENRVKILKDKVIKKTDKKEIETLMKAKDIIQNINEIIIDNTTYKIKVPEIYKINDESMEMELCKGENLEIMLRCESTHKNGVIYINEIIKFFIKNNFFWKDFAPRNILIDIEKREISIMDFERGIETKTEDLNLYFADYVYEEYSAFLLEEERIYKIEDIFNTKKEKTINIENIKSRRVRTILNVLGYEKEVTLSEYLLAIKMIVTNEKPYEKNGKIIYPLIELEEYMKKKDYKNYANKIIGDYNGKKNI